MTYATVYQTSVTQMFNATWCPKEDTRDNVRARRNVLTGLWAGRRLGLSGADLADYAADVHIADFKVSGDQDVIDKLLHDFAAHGHKVCREEIARKLAIFHAQSLKESWLTD